MGLSASLYSGVTGLLAHSERMSVIGNNLSNVNTTGFKSSHMYFEDFIPQDINTATGIAQIGRGVNVAGVFSDFGQSSFQSTTDSTDLAIGGNGFFMVKKKGTDATYYSRAGAFRFDKEGYLCEPSGLVLQGWKIQNQTTASASEATVSNATGTNTSVKLTGVPTDIRLQNFQSSPLQTGHMDLITNLDSNSSDNAVDTVNPCFAMFGNWDGQADKPLGDARYAYSSTIKIFDANGASHNVTVYFDPASVSNTGGRRVWEFMVTCNPSEDNRVFYDTLGNKQVVGTTAAAGALMIGHVTFNSSGQMENMAAYTLHSDAAGKNLQDISNWRLADFSQDGYPVFTANFLNSSNASFTDAAASNAQLIELNLGMRNSNLQGTVPTKGWNIPGSSSAYASSAGNGFTTLSGYKGQVQNALASTNYSTGSTTLYQSQDGYGAGFLQSVSVDKDGILTGKYSNGQVLQLFSITLANFNNKTGLRREGGNLYSQTRESGPALTGQANSGTLGSIASNSLEQSNVDMASEMVDMIVTQRGFQANSKTITTVDSMLQELVNLKR